MSSDINMTSFDFIRLLVYSFLQCKSRQSFLEKHFLLFSHFAVLFIIIHNYLEGQKVFRLRPFLLFVLRKRKSLKERPSGSKDVLVISLAARLNLVSETPVE